MRTRILTTLFALLMLAATHDARAAKWTVTNTAATGVGSLKAAVDSANAGLPGVPDTIAFAIPGAGPHFITRTSVLSITAPAVLIDGYTQAGSSVNTLATGDNAVLKIVLNGGTTGVDAIEVLGDSCRIRGLVIGGSWQNGIAIPGGTSNHVIEGNFIGVNPGGTTPLSNQNGIYMVAAFNRIGGSTAAARNVISANTSDGIALIGTGAIGSVIGNYIGTDRNGTSALGNSQGIQILNSAGCNIGGMAPGSGNLISGNDFGLIIQNGSSAVIQGNLIGTDPTGMLPLGNNHNIYIANSSFNQIGGSSAAARNVITAGGASNIYAFGAGSFHNVIQGNYIGTDATGLSAFSNSIGILFYGADSNQVGGAVLGQGNVICGHGATAIHLEDTADFNTVSGNFIGVGSDGVSVLTNGMGIDIVGGRNNLIGGPGANQGNVIANSLGGTGVRVTNFSTANWIRNNSIYGNAMYGIDLNNDGPIPFDTLDPDIGPNELQNAPILTSAVNTGSELVVSGYIWSEASKTYLVELFQSGSCDGSGYGEGEEWMDSFAVSTSPAGYIGFTRHIGPVASPGSVVTATATSPLGSTSEFTNCVVVTAPVDDTLRMFLFSPVSMVVTDPLGDSIGIDSASGVIFNTIGNTSAYDTTSDVNSSGLTGPDGSKDDIVTIPHPWTGPYQVRMFISDITGSTSFTMSIRINGNQQLVPDEYNNQSINALGNTVSPVFVWTASTTLAGDANADGNFTASDIIFLVNYIFKGGPATPVPGHGDANCSGTVTSADIIHMVNFIFKSGLHPCSQSGG